MIQQECRVQIFEKIDYLASRKTSFLSEVQFQADFKIELNILCYF